MSIGNDYTHIRGYIPDSLLILSRRIRILHSNSTGTLGGCSIYRAICFEMKLARDDHRKITIHKVRYYLLSIGFASAYMMDLVMIRLMKRIYALSLQQYHMFRILHTCYQVLD